MDNDVISNPFDKDEQKPRIAKIAMLGVAAVGICILFITAFIGFRPDQLSLSDRYFPSPTATITPSPTLTPTPTLTATPTPNLTATVQVIQSTAAAVSQWPILFSETFDTNENNWATGLDDDEYAKIAREVENGKYIWDATAKKGFVSWITADTKSVSDFALTVEIQQTAGSSSTDYGLIFRKDTKSDFYYFGIDNDSFHVSLNYNDEWIDVVDWTMSRAILPTGTNRLTVIAKGSYFIFLINDQFVADATNDRISRGTTALAIEVHGADLQAIFEFDNFELRVP